MAVLQKVPYICRTLEYGHSVHLTGTRPSNALWYSDPSTLDTVRARLTEWFLTPLRDMKTPLPFLLNNSNPLLHPSRCVPLFRGYERGASYPRQFLFYEEWTDESSELYLQADEELLNLCRAAGNVTIGEDVIPVKDYYAPGIHELTAKIQSIPAFHGIKAPMIKVDAERWIPDIGSRYFQEDFKCGTAPIIEFAHSLGVETPTLAYFMDWLSTFETKFDK